MVRACLPPAEAVPVRVPSPTRYPARALDEPLARIPRMAEIVEEGRILESDFKCAAVESDYPGVVKDIAGLAVLRANAYID
jgi:hypothetical protein